MVIAGPWLARPQQPLDAGLGGRHLLPGGDLRRPLRPLRRATPPPVYRGGDNDIVSLLDPEARLAKEAATLRWQGPAGARFELAVTTADLRPVATAGDLVEGSYTLPPAQLAALPAGTPCCGG